MQADFNPDLIQIEIVSRDLARSTKFYSEFLGWEIIPIEIFERIVFKVSTHQKFGICLRLDPKALEGSRVSGIRLVFKLNRSYDYLRNIEEFGGKWIKNLDPIPGYKHIVEVEDPDQNVLVLAFS